MNFTYKGNKENLVAIIKGRSKKKYVYYTFNDTRDAFSELELEGDEHFIPIPLKKKNQRSCINLTGSSGSGKSVLVGKMIAEYLKHHKDVNVYMISAGDTRNDPAFENIKFQQIDIEYYYNNGYELEDFSDTLLIFDDFSHFTDPNHSKFVLHLLNQLLERSRKLNCSIWVINHDARNFTKTKLLLLETKAFVMFPQHNKKSSRQLLQNYGEVDKDEITEMLGLNHGEFTFLYLCRVPSFYITNKKIKAL